MSNSGLSIPATMRVTDDQTLVDQVKCRTCNKEGVLRSHVFCDTHLHAGVVADVKRCSVCVCRRDRGTNKRALNAKMTRCCNKVTDESVKRWDTKRDLRACPLQPKEPLCGINHCAFQEHARISSACYRRQKGSTCAGRRAVVKAGIK